jgi:alpha-galactosidase
MDLHRWVAAFETAGKALMVENCHWGCTTPGYPKVKPSVFADNLECLAHNLRPSWPLEPMYPIQNDGACDGTEIVSKCPYHMYRTSADIKAEWDSMFKNLQSMTPFLGDPPLSRPGAWAYPDMLEVGQMASFEEDRTHFGAWCVVSSPLVLGLDLTDDSKMDRVWDIITNKEAIAVNQAWAGHPGRRVISEPYRQTWAKPLGEGRMAVFLLSAGAKNETVTITLSDFGFEDAVTIRDIWSRKDLGTSDKDTFVTDAFGGHDSRFYIFSPVGDRASVII